MKKGIVGLIVLLLAAVLAAGLFASSAEDYKVIKNAVSGPQAPKAGQKAQWFKILVVGKDKEGEKVKITLPVSLMEIIMNASPEKKFHVENGCEIDIRRVWNELKAAGPLALVEVEDHEETVKIWLE